MADSPPPPTLDPAVLVDGYERLRERVLTGKVSLLTAAQSATGAAKLVAAWRTASAADRVTLARTVGPTILFDGVLVPAL